MRIYLKPKPGIFPNSKRAGSSCFATIFISLLFTVFLQSCSVNRMLLNTTSKFFENSISVVYEEDDLDLAYHFFSSNLKIIEIMLSKDPSNRRMNLLAAQAFGAYSMAFIEDIDTRRASKLYLRGLKYAFASLPKQKRFNEKVKPQELETLLLEYNKSEVPYLFWVGYNWGSYVLHNLDNPRALVNLAKVEMIMRRILELDEEFNFAGVHLFYGSYYAARPPILGGNPEKGREHFERNIELTGNSFLLAKVYLARYYAVQVQDRELFNSLLDEVINTDIDKYPEIRLMNALAKKKAAEIKENELNFF